MSLSVLLVPFAISTTLTAISSIAAALNNLNTSVDSELGEKESEKTSKIIYEVIETDMKDLELLNKSVEYFKYDIKIGEKTTELQSDLVFFINENGNFSVMYNKKKKSEYLPVISEIREEYGKKVQEQRPQVQGINCILHIYLVFLHSCSVTLLFSYYIYKPYFLRNAPKQS